MGVQTGFARLERIACSVRDKHQAHPLDLRGWPLPRIRLAARPDHFPLASSRAAPACAGLPPRALACCKGHQPRGAPRYSSERRKRDGSRSGMLIYAQHTPQHATSSQPHFPTFLAATGLSAAYPPPRSRHRPIRCLAATTYSRHVASSRLCTAHSAHAARASTTDAHQNRIPRV